MLYDYFIRIHYRLFIQHIIVAFPFVADENEDDKPTLRDYQVEISRKIWQKKNDIIILPTGTGKTAVAAHLLHRYFKDYEEKGVYNSLYLVYSMLTALWIALM